MSELPYSAQPQFCWRIRTSGIWTLCTADIVVLMVWVASSPERKVVIDVFGRWDATTVPEFSSNIYELNCAIAIV